MTTEQKIAHFFQMTDEVWAHHANPWSGLTRFPILPLIIVSIWSLTWINWCCLIPIILLIIWTWINPRIFPKPTSTNNLFSKAVLGERVWLNRQKIKVPKHHYPVIRITNLISLAGLPFCVWGLIQLNIWSTILGVILVILGKTWFLDRMVWLYAEMKDNNSEYSSWLY
ncbi:MAG: hypothetical protein QNJ68_12065 [Microcoleaceae cyanobacterium MO_207.B10]|nr:hypothetical protein [Microcoleaceae cyanobacterium MO_207.B10]